MSTKFRRSRGGRYFAPTGSFPTIPSAASGQIVSAHQNNVTATRTFPTFSSLTYSTGDLLLGLVYSYGTNASFNWSAWDNGFTEVADIGVSGVMPLGAAYKWADGTESGSLTVHEDHTVSGYADMILMVIPNASATVPPEAGTGNTGTTSAVSANTLTPSWGALNTLWIAVAGNGNDANPGTFDGISAGPTSYSGFYAAGLSNGNANGTSASKGVVDGAVAFRQLNAASEGSGAFTLDTSSARNSIYMIAVHPV